MPCRNPDILSVVLDLAAPRDNVLLDIEQALAIIRAEFRAKRIALLPRSPGSLEPVPTVGNDFPLLDVRSKWNPGWTEDSPVPRGIYCPDTRSDRRFSGARIDQARPCFLAIADVVDGRNQKVTAFLWLDTYVEPYLCSDRPLRVLAFLCRCLGDQAIMQHSVAATDSLEDSILIEEYLLCTPIAEVWKAKI